MTCTNELMKIDISLNDKKKKRTHAGANKCQSFNFVFDLTAFAAAADRNKTTASLFSQDGIVPSPRAGHSFTKISVERAILFGGVTLQNRDEGVDNIFQQTCRDGRFYVLNIKEHSWSSLIGEIPPRAYHAAVLRSKTETLYILGGIQLANGNAVQYCNIQDITIVKINFATHHFLANVVQFPSLTPQYLSSQAATICDNIIHIFGGYKAHASTISTKPDLNSTMFAFDVDKMVYLSKMSKPEHATAGHSMFLLDKSTLLIYGGTKKEILLFTKLVPQADCCDLGEECIINQTDLIIPVT